MRQLKLQMRITIDGFVANTNGEEDWQIAPDEKVWQFIYELPDSADRLLIGRKMAEGFIPHFEGFEPSHPRYSFAQKMVNMPKVIFSKTLEKPFGKNTIVAKGNLADEIAQLKQQEGKDMLVYGGAGLVSALIEGGHIDEFYFLVIPVMLGKGIRIFDLIAQRYQLSLQNAIPYANGIVLLHYKLYND